MATQRIQTGDIQEMLTTARKKAADMAMNCSRDSACLSDLAQEQNDFEIKKHEKLVNDIDTTLSTLELVCGISLY